MKTFFVAIVLVCSSFGTSEACNKCSEYNNSSFKITSTSVTHNADLGVTIWEIVVDGSAGATTPKPNGELNGAPVLGYVFPTTLKPTDVGFNQTEGIVALALTSHPDFDDSPLWDENADRINNKTNFKFDAVTCYMEVNTGSAGGHADEGEKPMLGVYNVYSVASGDLSLPYSVK